MKRLAVAAVAAVMVLGAGLGAALPGGLVRPDVAVAASLTSPLKTTTSTRTTLAPSYMSAPTTTTFTESAPGEPVHTTASTQSSGSPPQKPLYRWGLFAIEIAVLIGFIALGARSGGIGLGFWGGVGTLVLVFLFREDPGDPPLDAMLIIVTVISAAASMEAAGGVDYLLMLASKVLRARPQAINYIAPFVAYLLTILTGTTNTFFSIIPVIYEVAYANEIRPERPLASSNVASTLGITSSPVSAAMATLLPLVKIEGFNLPEVLVITIPASIVGITVMSFVMSRYRKELNEDPEYKRRLQAGLVEPPTPVGDIELKAHARRSVAIFLGAVLVICIFGIFEGIRPTVVGEAGGAEPLSMTILIEVLMFTAAALILVTCRVKAGDVPGMSIFRSGMVAMVALFGIAWMADTFIANNEATIASALGGLATRWPFTFAMAIFLVAALMKSMAAATRTMIPLGLAAGLPAGYLIAFWIAVAGVVFLPISGRQIASVDADRTGTTTLGKAVLDHSFQVPLQIAWVVSVLVAIGIVRVFFH